MLYTSVTSYPNARMLSPDNFTVTDGNEVELEIKNVMFDSATNLLALEVSGGIPAREYTISSNELKDIDGNDSHLFDKTYLVSEYPAVPYSESVKSVELFKDGVPCITAKKYGKYEVCIELYDGECDDDLTVDIYGTRRGLLVSGATPDSDGFIRESITLFYKEGVYIKCNN